MLVSSQYSLAIPGAVQSLKFLREIFGEGSVESVPPYLLLAEANLGLGKFQQAEEVSDFFFLGREGEINWWGRRDNSLQTVLSAVTLNN